MATVPVSGLLSSLAKPRSNRHSTKRPRVSPVLIKKDFLHVCAAEENQEKDRVPIPEKKRSADSTDAVASFLTRRFGYPYCR